MRKLKCSKSQSVRLILLSTLYAILLPILILLTIPFSACRYFLSKSAKSLRPDLLGIVTARGSIMSGDRFYTNPIYNVVCRVTIRGSVNVEEAKNLVWQNLVNVKLENGDFKYPELQAYLSTWLGYYFWAKDPDFRIENHVKEIGPGKENSEAEVQKIQHDLVVCAWVPKRPLWEFVFVPNCSQNGRLNTTMFFRQHHILGDGVAITRIVGKHLFNFKMPSVQPTTNKNNIASAVFKFITFPFTAVHALALEASMTMDAKDVPFKPVSENELIQFTESDRFSFKVMHNIKVRHAVSLWTVVNTMFAGAVREFCISKGMTVPETFPCSMALPFPWRPGNCEEFRNHVTMGILELPTGEADARIRLKKIEERYQKLKMSVFPIVFAFLIPLAGSYPINCIKLFQRFFGIALYLSNYSFGVETWFFEGQKVEEIMFSSVGNAGLSAFVTSYTDGFRFALTAKGGVKTQKDLDLIASLIRQQLELL